jgi:hypothetical protein
MFKTTTIAESIDTTKESKARISFLQNSYVGNPSRHTEIKIPINHVTGLSKQSVQAEQSVQAKQSVQTASDIFDPTLSSPPNEFIQNLRLRMDVYFEKPHSMAERGVCKIH